MEIHTPHSCSLLRQLTDFTRAFPQTLQILPINNMDTTLLSLIINMQKIPLQHRMDFIFEILLLNLHD